MGDVKTRMLVDATPIIQLYDRIGRLKAAELLGVSNSNFTRWRASGKAAKPYVLAAQYELSKMDKAANGWALAVVAVPADKRQAFEAITVGLELDTKYFVS